MQFADDYKVGDTFKIGSHTITSKEIIDFARNYDPQPYHLSEEGGNASPFGGLIASGWNTASIWMKLYVTNMLKDARIYGSPGIDELRWKAPVRPGDVLEGRVEVLERCPSLTAPDIVTIKKLGSLWIGNADSPVCSLIIHSRFGKRQKDNS